MKITKTIRISEWNDSTRQKIANFWEGRKIRFCENSDSGLIGRRGSIFGNILSFDMKNLITNIVIKKDSDSEIICEININTIFQQITRSNKEYWELELKTFESVLRYDDDREDEWKEYLKNAKKSSIKWVIVTVIGTIILLEILRQIFG
jgi:hypothetical protein